MSTAIEWSLGLPCPDQRDAIVASVIDATHASSGTATNDHLRRCPACRSFRDSLRTQRMLVKRVAEHQEEQRKQAWQRRLKTELTEWVDGELKVRAERGIAKTLSRCGAAVLRLDTDVARGVLAESTTGEFDETPIETMLTNAASSLTATSQSEDERRGGKERIRNKLTALQDSISRFIPLDLGARIETIDLISRMAEQIFAGVRGPARMLMANVEWYHGDSSRVPGLLNQALRAASDSAQVAHALANLALWNSSQGSFASAIDLNCEAARCAMRFASPRVNLAVWTSMSGDRRSADHHFADAVAIVGQVLFRRHWPWTLLHRCLDRCLVLADAPTRDRARAVDSMWIAYHRWSGLPPSYSARATRSQLESSS